MRAIGWIMKFDQNPRKFVGEIDGTEKLNACTDGDRCFCFHNLRLQNCQKTKRKKKNSSRRQPAGGLMEPLSTPRPSAAPWKGRRSARRRIARGSRAPPTPRRRRSSARSCTRRRAPGAAAAARARSRWSRAGSASSPA